MNEERFYTNRDVSDLEVQQLSENVKGLSTDIQAICAILKQGDFTYTIRKEQRDYDAQIIQRAMDAAARNIVIRPPEAKLPDSAIAFMTIVSKEPERFIRRPLLPDKPDRKHWWLLIAFTILNIILALFLGYKMHLSPYAWGIRAHKVAIELNLPQQKEAFWSTVEAFHSGHKNQAKGRVRDWEKRKEKGE